MTRALLALALTCSLASAAPVPRERLTEAAMSGRWTCSHWGSGAWWLWLDADGHCRSGHSATGGVSWVGRWALRGDAIEVWEWAVHDEEKRAKYYRIPLSQLSERKVER